MVEAIPWSTDFREKVDQGVLTSLDKCNVHTHPQIQPETKVEFLTRIFSNVCTLVFFESLAFRDPAPVVLRKGFSDRARCTAEKRMTCETATCSCYSVALLNVMDCIYIWPVKNRKSVMS